MGRSKYFSQKFQPEANLLEDIIVESISVYGFECYYMPRTRVSTDRTLGEDTESTFSSAINIEMYIENVDGYGGDGVLLSKFGINIRHQMRMVVSRRRFDAARGNQVFANLRPYEGDLIYIPLVHGLYEIKFVDLETPFYQFQNLPVYKMTCELFEYRGEDLATGIIEIDALQNANSRESSYRVVYSGAKVGFILNEKVTLTYPNPGGGTSVSGSAEITGIFETSTDVRTTLQLSDLRFPAGVIRPLATGVTITGITSGVTGTISHVVNLTDGDTALSDGNTAMENNAFETRGNDILDFTETNPFGLPNDA